jgi:hypothetical protein
MTTDSSSVPNIESTRSTTAELSRLAKEAVLNRIRQESRIDFWEDIMAWRLMAQEIPKFLGLKDGHGHSPTTLCAALKKAKARYDSFSVAVESEADGKEINVLIKLKEGAEWRSVWEEAWQLAATPNEHCLSDNAVKLLRWARSDKNTGEPIEQDRIMRQAQLRGAYLQVRDCFREIQVKAEPLLAFDRRMKGGPMVVRFCKEPARYYEVGPLNPALGISVTKPKRPDLLRFKTWLYSEIRRIEFPNETTGLGVYEIADQKALRSCFSEWPRGFAWDSPLTEFFSAVQVMEGLKILTLFEQGLGPWIVVCRPSDGWTWSRVKAQLAERATELGPAKQYSLSADSALLFEWIRDLRPDQYLGNLTPVLEDCMERDIGLKPEWPKENLSAFFEMLAEEINAKTDFDLKLQPWQSYSTKSTRIRVGRKVSELDQVVRSIQVLAASHNKPLEGSQVRTAIESLLS